MRTPVTKEIVELHKIHKAIENKNGGSGGGGGGTPSGDATIDNVVKFIHDTFADIGYSDYFPYTTWEDIPWHEDANAGEICKAQRSGRNFQNYLLNIPDYMIGEKGQDAPPKNVKG